MHSTSDAGVETVVVEAPKTGQTVSGDGYLVLSDAGGTLVVVVDALGNGPAAAEVANLALSVVEEGRHLSIQNLFEVLERQLAGGRGAVAAAARIIAGQHSLTWAGIGDVQGVIVADGERTTLVARPGILGYRSPPASQSTQPFGPGSVLCLATDGVAGDYALAISHRIGLEGNARHLQPFLGSDDDALFLLARLSPVIATG